MLNLYTTIDSLCAQNGISISQLCKLMSISRSTLSELNAGRTKHLSYSTLIKLADYFNVDIVFFNREFDDNSCPKCGNTIDAPGVNPEVHAELHSKWKKAVSKFGFCWNDVYREEVKGRARGELEANKDLPSQEIANLHILIFKALFSRSLEGDAYQLSHITFNEYCGALLNQAQFKNRIAKSAYNLLVQKYGTNDLIPEGTYYQKYYPIDTINALKKRQKETNKSYTHAQDEAEIIEKYRALDKHGKEIADLIINKEYERCTALTKSAPAPTLRIKHSIYKASAGFGFDLEDRDEWDEIDIPDTPEANEADFAVTIYGNSMEPIYHDSDIVLIKIQDRVNIGETGIFIVNGQGFIKQYGGDRLISVNSDYEDIIFREDDFIKCAGKVLGTAQQVK